MTLILKSLIIHLPLNLKYWTNLALANLIHPNVQTTTVNQKSIQFIQQAKGSISE